MIHVYKIYLHYNLSVLTKILFHPYTPYSSFTALKLWIYNWHLFFPIFILFHFPSQIVIEVNNSKDVPVEKLVYIHNHEM